jgi:hypothetical protein
MRTPVQNGSDVIARESSLRDFTRETAFPRDREEWLIPLLGRRNCRPHSAHRE